MRRSAWGMTANVAAMSAGGTHVALIPLTSIYHQPDGKPAVWIYDPQAQKVDLREVELGPFREDGVIVKRGLAMANGWSPRASTSCSRTGGQTYEQPGSPCRSQLPYRCRSRRVNRCETR